MFCIETEKLKLTLEIVPVASLISHEEVLPASANRMVLEFKNLASLQNPIIVDENHIVLDGNHRVHAFRTLNFNFIPVCKIDYFNRRTKLRYWFRIIGNLEDRHRVREIITVPGGNPAYATRPLHPEKNHGNKMPGLWAAISRRMFPCGFS